MRIDKFYWDTPEKKLVLALEDGRHSEIFFTNEEFESISESHDKMKEDKERLRQIEKESKKSSSDFLDALLKIKADKLKLKNDLEYNRNR